MNDEFVSFPTRDTPNNNMLLSHGVLSTCSNTHLLRFLPFDLVRLHLLSRPLTFLVVAKGNRNLFLDRRSLDMTGSCFEGRPPTNGSVPCRVPSKAIKKGGAHKKDRPMLLLHRPGSSLVSLGLAMPDSNSADDQGLISGKGN